MKKAKKVIALTLCAVMLVVGSVAGTLAYLADTDAVVNTFTVGKVDIKLDEKNTDGKDANGNDNSSVARDQANAYKLLPGQPYEKDPTVTVLEGSENSYIKMTMTLSNANELDEIFKPDGAAMTAIFAGYNSEKWIYKGNVKDAGNNTRTYEFWYKDAVEALDEEKTLEPLFKQIIVPGEITNAQLNTINNMTITVNAYAIQATGFTDAADAWSKAPEQWAEYSTQQ